MHKYQTSALRYLLERLKNSHICKDHAYSHSIVDCCNFLLDEVLL